MSDPAGRRFRGGRLSRPPQATVIGDSDAGPETRALAERVGGMLAQLGVTVITGGGAGVMEAASRGAREAGGLTISILPSAEMKDANAWSGVVLPTGLGHGRNVITALAGDAIIALGGAAGTLSEICFAWIHHRPIYTLKGCGGWASKVGGGPLDHRAEAEIRECANLDELMEELVSLFGKMGWRIHPEK
jgi:uncharacterized protein (TIGR00725 family)